MGDRYRDGDKIGISLSYVRDTRSVRGAMLRCGGFEATGWRAHWSPIDCEGILLHVPCYVLHVTVPRLRLRCAFHVALLHPSSLILDAIDCWRHMFLSRFYQF
jgi:hypothetical protein